MREGKGLIGKATRGEDWNRVERQCGKEWGGRKGRRRKGVGKGLGNADKKGRKEKDGKKRADNISRKEKTDKKGWRISRR